MKFQKKLMLCVGALWKKVNLCMASFNNVIRMHTYTLAYGSISLNEYIELNELKTVGNMSTS